MKKLEEQKLISLISNIQVIVMRLKANDIPEIFDEVFEDITKIESLLLTLCSHDLYKFIDNLDKAYYQAIYNTTFRRQMGIIVDVLRIEKLLVSNGSMFNDILNKLDVYLVQTSKVLCDNSGLDSTMSAITHGLLDLRFYILEANFDKFTFALKSFKLAIINHNKAILNYQKLVRNLPLLNINYIYTNQGKEALC